MYLCVYIPVAVLSCVESSTVAGLASCPLTMIAHTVTTPSPSPAVYNVLSRPIMIPGGRKGEIGGRKEGRGEGGAEE